MAHDVFISYSNEDKLTADAVCAMLEARRIRCWIAPRDVIPGQDYAEQLMQAIRGAGLMVLIFSSSANSSPHVMREVERAGDRGIPILPFRIEDVPPSDSMEYYIGTTHWLDALTPPLEKHIGKLAARAQVLLAKSGRVVPEREEPARPSVAGEAPKTPVPTEPARPWYRRTRVLLSSALAVIVVVAAIVVAALVTGDRDRAADQGALTTVTVSTASPTTGLAATTTTTMAATTTTMAPTTTTAAASTTAPTASTTTTSLASLVWRSEVRKNEPLVLWGRLAGVVAVSEGTVYAVTDDNYLHALDADSGEEKWNLGSLGQLGSFPAIQDGVIYGDWRDSEFQAVEAETGSKKWSFQTAGRVGYCPAVVDGVAYVGSEGNWFHALDAKTGREKWRYEGAYSDFRYPAVSNGVICFASYHSDNRAGENYLYALDAASGYEKWKLETLLEISYPAMSNGLVYYGSRDGLLHALDVENGEEQWTFEAGVEILIAPVASGENVYLECGGTSGYVYALDAGSGVETWRFKMTPVFPQNKKCLTISNGVIYFGSDDKYLHAVDAETGTEKWRFQMLGKPQGAPAVSNGVVYTTDGQYVYAVK